MSNREADLIIIYEKTHSSDAGDSKDSASEGPKGSLKGDIIAPVDHLNFKVDGSTTLRDGNELFDSPATLSRGANKT